RIDDATIDAALAEACVGKKTFAELRKADLPGLLLAALAEHRDRFEKLAPAHVTLGGGRRLRVHYEVDRGPWIESRLQDFFGTARGPAIAEGREPLAIHLLAPNQRAVQITTDLAGFWSRHYPELRRALMRRYPKHDWPEDPLHATPPAPRSRR
ncbi:MAG TPA: ATP-dependent helicase C-terminal domain-containing protein, partial [Nannocystaceae bacterium]|nr:ATP-dependent helicase C-terminal domain-containing protein [Nannocystaceae bacterium]